MVCTNLSAAGGGGEVVETPTKFLRSRDLIGSQILEGVDLSQGGLQFLNKK